MQATDSICWLIRNVSVSLFADFVVLKLQLIDDIISDFYHLKKKGHFIGKVDPNTPASAGGLKVGDRIIEVNGHNVVNETHKQVKF
jgi:C-terminal processing protease CtpA/Prc